MFPVAFDAHAKAVSLSIEHAIPTVMSALGKQTCKAVTCHVMQVSCNHHMQCSSAFSSYSARMCLDVLRWGWSDAVEYYSNFCLQQALEDVPDSVCTLLSCSGHFDKSCRRQVFTVWTPVTWLRTCVVCNNNINGNNGFDFITFMSKWLSWDTEVMSQDDGHCNNLSLTALPVKVPVLSKHTTSTSAMVLIFSGMSTWMCSDLRHTTL